MVLVLKLKMIYRLDLELKCGRDFEVEVQSIFWMSGLDEMQNLEFDLDFKAKVGKNLKVGFGQDFQSLSPYLVQIFRRNLFSYFGAEDWSK